MPSSRAPSTVSNRASSPAAWPSVRLSPRWLRPPPVAVHDGGDVARDPRRGRCPSRVPGADATPGDPAARDTVMSMGLRHVAGNAPTVPSVKEKLAGEPVTRSAAARCRTASASQAAPRLGVTLSVFLSLIPLLLVAIAVVGFVAAGDPTSPTTSSTTSAPAPAARPRRRSRDAHRDRRGARQARVDHRLRRPAVDGPRRRRRRRSRRATARGSHRPGLRDKVGCRAVAARRRRLFGWRRSPLGLGRERPARLAWRRCPVLVGLACSSGFFLWTFSVLAGSPVGWRALLPGAVLVRRRLRDPQARRHRLRAPAGGLLVGAVRLARRRLRPPRLARFFGRLLVYGAVVNVVRWERAHGTVQVAVEAPGSTARSRSAPTARAPSPTASTTSPPERTEPSPGPRSVERWPRPRSPRPWRRSWPSSRAAARRARARCEMAEAVADAISPAATWWCRPAPAPARPSPTSSRPSSPAHGGRRHRHQGPAGPAGRQGPALPRRPPAAAVTFAVLKGRSNYLCRQRVTEVAAAADQGSRSTGSSRRTPEAELRLLEWAADDRRRRPGRARLRAVDPRRGARCRCRLRRVPRRGQVPEGRGVLRRGRPTAAAEADVLVVNTHLYGTHLAAGGVVLPRARRGGVRRGPPARGGPVRHLRHRAHRRPRSAARGLRLGRSSPTTRWSPTMPRRLVPARRRARRPRGRAARPAAGPASRPADPAPHEARAASAALKAVPDSNVDVVARRNRANQQLLGLSEAILRASWCPPAAWPGSRARPGSPKLRIAPIDVAGPSTERPVAGDHGRAHARPPSRLACRPASACRRPTPPSSTSAARSTTRPTPSSTAPPTCPTPARTGCRRRPRRDRRAHRGRRRPDPGPVHLVAGHAGRGRRAAAPALHAGAGPGRAAQAGADRRPSPRTSRLPVRHHGLLAGRRRPRPDAVAASSSTGCPSPGPTIRCSRPGGSWSASGRSSSSTCPRASTLLAQGAGPPDPHRRRPRRGRRARPPPGHRPLPLGHHQGPAAHAPHEGPGRGPRLPPRPRLTCAACRPSPCCRDPSSSPATSWAASSPTC